MPARISSTWRYSTSISSYRTVASPRLIIKPRASRASRTCRPNIWIQYVFAQHIQLRTGIGEHRNNYINILITCGCDLAKTIVDEFREHTGFVYKLSQMAPERTGILPDFRDGKGSWTGFTFSGWYLLWACHTFGLVCSRRGSSLASPMRILLRQVAHIGILQTMLGTTSASSRAETAQDEASWLYNLSGRWYF